MSPGGPSVVGVITKDVGCGTGQGLAISCSIVVVVRSCPTLAVQGSSAAGCLVGAPPGVVAQQLQEIRVPVTNYSRAVADSVGIQVMVERRWPDRFAARADRPNFKTA